MQNRFRFRVWNYRSKKYLYHAESGISTSYSSLHIPFSLLDDVEDIAIEQCTGLKDKNGKLIYENDILKTIDGSDLIGKVFYNDTFGIYMMTCLYNQQDIALENYVDLDTLKLKLEVVGNVHEYTKIAYDK